MCEMISIDLLSVIRRSRAELNILHTRMFQDHHSVLMRTLTVWQKTKISLEENSQFNIFKTFFFSCKMQHETRCFQTRVQQSWAGTVKSSMAAGKVVIKHIQKTQFIPHSCGPSAPDAQSTGVHFKISSSSGGADSLVYLLQLFVFVDLWHLQLLASV